MRAVEEGDVRPESLCGDVVGDFGGVEVGHVGER